MIATFAASSAVIAFEFMRICKIDAYPKDEGIVSWRTVLFGGALASIINSLGSTWLKSGYFDAALILEVITRFVLGDVMGLIVGMFTIMFVTRYMRKHGLRT